MILVTVGTHGQPFDRLVRAAGELALLERVVLQRGTSRLAPAGCEVHDRVDPEVLQGWMAEARIVVCHAGPATIHESVCAGHLPIVVPRRRLWREHVDDHQLAWVRRIAHRVHVVEDPSALVEAVGDHERVVEGLSDPWRAVNGGAWVSALRQRWG